MTQTSIYILLRASLITFLLLSLCFPSSSTNVENEKKSLEHTKTRALLNHQFHSLENKKRLLLEDSDLPFHGRKLKKKKKKKKKKYGKSSANQTGMSMFRATSIFCISLFVSFILV
ncbi:transmembrane protein, putative [Medicago truncatula]|uniref:Transmembrane protein, putative n=1 Tax=Medicago truncatula TaxID=3880 RepID=A0A072TGF1_MEDTR|nr:transmembrane protein, putative [Medicago truncatula]